MAEYLLETGIAELSLRSAAAAIGVSHVTLVRHFATREDLITEVVAKIRSDLVARIRADLRDYPTAGLAEFVERQWRQFSATDEARQFLLLFEITARNGRAAPDSRLDIGQSLTIDITDPLREELARRFAMSARCAEELATVLTAQIRGLMLDLMLSGERDRVDRAMHSFIAHIAQNLDPVVNPHG
ncbi:TetR/AcrR family transcriptional regulator [Nocardia nova]|uniref:TetR/AcrR family transcriptional regulator n=1 Tax=Nocardia nova TaxID=37330 RepID=UPI001E65DF7E|nr:TetR/AcrR family transcriptional regulator [Nocardia nova]